MSHDENKMIGNVDWLKEYDLHLEDTVSCDTIDCSRPATHFTRVACCSAVMIGCENCLANAYRTVSLVIASRQKVMCRGCNKANDPKGWLSRPEKLSLL